MIITQKITMDLACCGKIPEIDAVQNDRYTRQLALELKEQGNLWQIPRDASAVIVYEKPDGTCGRYDVLPDGTIGWSVDRHVLTVTLAPQVLTASGEVQLSVQLVRGIQAVSTFRILVRVQPNLASRVLASENYVNLTAGDSSGLEGKVNSSGWPANRYLGTDANGNVVDKAAPVVLPAVTAADDGKFLRVSGGAWTAEAVEAAEEVSY